MRITKNLMLSLLAAVILSVPGMAQSVIDADNPHIQYVGRFDLSDAKRPTCDWPGCYVEAVFQGTSVAIKMAAMIPVIEQAMGW